MNRYDQDQVQVSYPVSSTGAPAQQTYVVPPPVGYPARDGQGSAQNYPPAETRSRGDGFWKGCCAALCCCCALDACF